MPIKSSKPAPNNEGSPYPKSQWFSIKALGRQVDELLQGRDVRLTMGGEPTFVALDALDSPQWQTEALGEDKRRRAELLLEGLCNHAPAGALVHDGVGKCYPGESLPRWALGCYWRNDGEALWRDPSLLAGFDARGKAGVARAGRFIEGLGRRAGVGRGCIIEAFEESSPEVVGYVLPLLRIQGAEGPYWGSCKWHVPGDRLVLTPGVGVLGLRLPLNRIDWPEVEGLAQEAGSASSVACVDAGRRTLQDNSIKVALCIEVKDGILQIFLPPIACADSFIDLVSLIEDTAAGMGCEVRIGGYALEPAGQLQGFTLTPDPGVLEVNSQPASRWSQLVEQTFVLHREAKRCGLGTKKFLPDGRTVGTGGGHHLVLGAATADQSPFLRRPDLLASLIGYWQNHPGLSYAFCGLFVGPTSQAPRIDEARHDSLYHLELAFAQLEQSQNLSGEELHRLFDHLLVDVSGSAHRSEFCIDKLFPPHHPHNRRGLLEMRGFEMLPEPALGLVVALLVRCLVAWFWQQPWRRELVRWGSALQDRFALPYFIGRDLDLVVEDLQQFGMAFHRQWLEPQLLWRFPQVGELLVPGGVLSLRQAIEPWPVLGAEVASGAASRPVDSSCERLEVLFQSEEAERYVVLCNGRRVPLGATGQADLKVAGVRFKAWPLELALLPDLRPQVPLEFEVVDSASGEGLGGCRYFTESPDAGAYDGIPASAEEADERRRERFQVFGPRQGLRAMINGQVHPEFPMTLDLRWPQGSQGEAPGENKKGER